MCNVLSAPGCVHTIALLIRNSKIINSAINRITEIMIKNIAKALSFPRDIESKVLLLYLRVYFVVLDVCLVGVKKNA